MATTNAAATPATEILVRLDRGTNTPLVFIANTYDGAQVQVWSETGGLRMMPKHEYDLTFPLAAKDEEAVAANYSQKTGNAIVLRSRLPRQQRPRMSLTGNPAPVQAQTPAAQPQQQPAATPANAPANIPASSLSSAEILEQIKEASARKQTLTTLVGDLSAQLAKATADHTQAETDYNIFTAQYHAAVKREAEEEMKRREEQLRAVLANTAPADPLAAAAQQLHDSQTAETKQQEQQAPVAQQQATQTPRGAGGKFVKKDDAKGNSKGNGNKGNKTPAIARKTAPRTRNTGGGRRPAAKPV